MHYIIYFIIRNIMQFYGIINCYLFKYIKSSRRSSRPNKAGPCKQSCKNTSDTWRFIFNGVASSKSEGGIFIYSCSAQLISFEIESVSEGINCAEHEFMNMSPSLIELATPLLILSQTHC